MLKRSLFIIFSFLIVIPMFLGTAVYGVTDENSNSQSTTVTNSESETETAEQKTLRENRIKARIDKQQIKLSESEKNKIKAKCIASQGKISNVKAKINGIETSRTNVHENSLNRLNKLVEKLKAKNINTTELETAIEELSTKIELFKTDLATYKLAVSDLQVMDCKTDPDGFKVSLLAARSSLEKVRTDAKDIKTYFKETIKPLLKSIRQQISPDTSETKPTESNEGEQ